jgi:hypothetical protein
LIKLKSTNKWDVIPEWPNGDWLSNFYIFLDKGT